ncbi:XRE family transcriptional regulator [Nocardiopsis aegyptia]|uniref:helix-turn-helix domain-containing protein n=1 Tax=Nocardiopsis aegyptia TaxID=220378 RepID=UPI00367176A0
MTERIRRARQAKGWSQSRLIYEIEQYARHKLLPVAATSSLRTYVSEWENGRRSIGEPYRSILRSLFGMTDQELYEQTAQTFPEVDGYDELVARIDAAHVISRSVVETFDRQTELLRTIDRQMGAAQLTDQMSAHLDTLNEALTFAVLPDSRRPVAEALAGASTLAAWQALDVGAADRAWRHYELAKTAAREAEQPKYLAHAMGEQAYVLADAGKTSVAVQLVEEALRVGGRAIPARLTAWLWAAKAELHAQNGDEVDCRDALDSAARHLPADNALRDPSMPSIFLTEAHMTRWRGNALALLGDEGAVTDLYSALEGMDPSFSRAQSGLHADLAQAHLIRGEHSEAAEQLRAARLLANRTGSVRHRRRIERLTMRL